MNNGLLVCYSSHDLKTVVFCLVVMLWLAYRTIVMQWAACYKSVIRMVSVIWIPTVNKLSHKFDTTIGLLKFQITGRGPKD